MDVRIAKAFGWSLVSVSLSRPVCLCLSDCLVVAADEKMLGIGGVHTFYEQDPARWKGDGWREEGGRGREMKRNTKRSKFMILACLAACEGEVQSDGQGQAACPWGYSP